jgi:ApbE superfamily uncharacterized protein (UPF0280 family)
MSHGPHRTRLPDGREHFAHGPIELVIAAQGPAAAEAFEQAWQRFGSVLTELVTELPRLRTPVQPDRPCPLEGIVARRMWAACAALPIEFITPMAAVAGAVAEEILAIFDRPDIERAFVNNGGDIALHLTPGTEWRIGLVADIARAYPAMLVRQQSDAAPGPSTDAAVPPPFMLDGQFTVRAADPVRGIATSGWRGRSHSMGIADAVTVLARTAAQADAAATLIANAVNVDDSRIARAPAAHLRDDSDLGERLVTVQVEPLPPDLVRQALASGEAAARDLHSRGLIHAAVLACQGQIALVEARSLLSPVPGMGADASAHRQATLAQAA